MSPFRLSSLVCAALAALTAAALVAGCDSPPPPSGCTSSASCGAGQVCVDGECVTATDAGGGTDAGGRDSGGSCAPESLCRAGTLCCGAGEECVEDRACLPICANTRCGDNSSLCCAAGQVCLDGVVCAADCAPDQALCGADSELCCAAGQVCQNDACVDPGIECDNDFDCRDAALYCEPTIGRCLPTPGGGPGDPVCEVRPEFDDVSLIEEWHVGEVTLGGTVYRNVIHWPIVGDVSGDGVPDVVVPFYPGTAFDNPVLVGLSGDTGAELFIIGRGASEAAEAEGIVLANFDPSDEALEIAYRLDSGGVRIVDGDGMTELGVRVDSNVRGSLETADFNHDGVPDLISGCDVYDGVDISDSTLDIMANGTCTVQSTWSTSVAADIDGDGELELTNGGVAYNHDGSVLWSGGFAGLVAIADLDVDGTPEVISINGGEIRVLEGATGAVLVGPGGSWLNGTQALPGGGTGGAPTVADFDGDGLPEISAAGRGAYVVYDLDCIAPSPRSGGDDCMTGTFLKWQAPTQDISSSVTGSSVFDFQGDGVAEVVYNDECFLHVYDGRDGRELLMDPIPSSSRTGFEYPIVVDVDGDGNSEIVVGSNNDQAVSRDNCDDAYVRAFPEYSSVSELPPEFRTGTHGVTVYGDAFDRWVPTRPIWNQFSYHVTNVSPTGEVPTTERNNWEDPNLNNYRQNVQGEGVFNAPDLSVTLQATTRCSAREIALSAVIRNVGSRGVPAGVLVEFWQTIPGPEALVGMANTSAPLLPGGSERLTVLVTDVPVDTDLTYEARVDPDTSATSVIECNEDNNNDTDEDRCDGLL